MSWDSYIVTLMDSNTRDAAIVGIESDKQYVWAAHTGGTLAKITPEEIRKLTDSNRGSLFSAGVTLAGMKCAVLRDQLHLEGQFTLDLRTKTSDKETDTFSISVGKTNTCLVIVMGNVGVAGGILNSAVFKMVEYLRSNHC